MDVIVAEAPRFVDETANQNRLAQTNASCLNNI